jgi:hypothetical protein
MTSLICKCINTYVNLLPTFILPTSIINYSYETNKISRFEKYYGLNEISKKTIYSFLFGLSYPIMYPYLINKTIYNHRKKELKSDIFE